MLHYSPGYLITGCETLGQRLTINFWPLNTLISPYACDKNSDECTKKGYQTISSSG